MQSSVPYGTEGWVMGYRAEVLTDHKSLESWRTEHVDTPGGSAGRRHEYLNKFDLHVICIPGHYNTLLDLPCLRGLLRSAFSWDID